MIRSNRPSSFLKKHALALGLVVGFPVYALVTQLDGKCSSCSPTGGGFPFLPIATADAAPLTRNGPAPAWELKNLDGKTVKSSDFDGKVVMLNFWGTWCPPCVAEIPELIKLQKKFADRGFTVIGIANEPPGTGIKAFVKKAGINYPVVLATEQVMGDFDNVQMFPTTFFIDRKGRVVSGIIGPGSESNFEEIIEPLL